MSQQYTHYDDIAEKVDSIDGLLQKRAGKIPIRPDTTAY